MRYAIVGAGMSGLACADALKQAGHSVSIFEKSRGAGGRMATRRLPTPVGEVRIDHGAQYFTARDPGFARLVAAWRDVGVALPWPLAGPEAWIGVPGMSAVIKQMAGAHDVTWGQHVTAVRRRNGEWWLASQAEEVGPFDATLLAMPAEQAATILSLHDFSMARIALLARSQPCWATMFVFDRPLDNLPVLIRDRGAIGWAARNSAKPGRGGAEAWIVQATGPWSRAHLEASPEHISAMLYEALSDAMGCALPPAVFALSHRWRYALSAGTGDGALWNETIGLGACGDWLLGPRIECAWLSGRLLARRCNGSDQDLLATSGPAQAFEAGRQFAWPR